MPVGQNTRANFPPRLSIPARKNIPLYRNSDLSYVRDTLTRNKGRIAIVTNRGLGSDGRDGVGRGEPCRAGNREHRLSCLRHGADSVFAWLRVRAHASSRRPSEDVRGRSSRVVLTPGVCASSPVVMRAARPGARISDLRGDGGNSASLPGESTKYTVNHRAGKAGRLADLWSTPCAFLWRTDLRVPAGARPSLRPCYREGDATRQSSGGYAARMRRRVLRRKCKLMVSESSSSSVNCERSEAIQNPSTGTAGIASLRSQ
ncbi:hypothetical protein ABIB68_002375 [Bradyrhizobium sp. F1.2.2]